jgi:hypothetical protein
MKFVFDVKELKSDRREAGMRIVEATVYMQTLPIIPNKVNIRNFKPQNPNYKRMKDQLATEELGKKFRIKNNGIADSVATLRVINGGSQIEVTIDDLDIHGRFNGNHTQMAAQAAQKDPDKHPGIVQAEVDVVFYVGATREEVVELARASNSGMAQSKNDIFNAEGVFDPLFEVLEERSRKLVQRKAGDVPSSEAPFLGSDLVRRVAIMDNEAYPIEKGRHPKRAYSGAGGVANSWAAGKFTNNLPLLQEIVDLEGLICKYIVSSADPNAKHPSAQKRQGIEMFGREDEEKYHKPELLLAGELLPKTTASAFVWPILASFRVFIKNGKFIEPVAVLFGKHGPSLIRHVRNLYNGEAFDAFAKLDSTWKSVASTMLDRAADDGVVISTKKTRKKAA